MPSARSQLLIEASRRVCRDLARLEFSEPVTHVYNPLLYARASHEAYLSRFGGTRKRILFLGMNPGPWGMAQTGVPFGEIPAVRDWMKIEEPVKKPRNEHPKRPIEGFACERSEVSGRRLWGLFAERFPEAREFFRKHFVSNYCPLVFMEETGRNRTPDKIPGAEIEAVQKACDVFLQRIVEALEPEWIIGVGAFAETRARAALGDFQLKFGRILHPSPASPAANRGWAEAATKQLEALELW